MGSSSDAPIPEPVEVDAAAKTTPSKTYRVVVTVSVSDDDVRRCAGAEDRDPSDHRDWIESEFGWVHESFSDVSIDSITEVADESRAETATEMVTPAPEWTPVTCKEVCDWLWAHSPVRPLRWQSVLDFFEDRFGSEDHPDDEYFHLTTNAPCQASDAVWDNVHWVVAFWVVGDSEGFYTHVERRVDVPGAMHYGAQADLVCLGKFWSSKRAAQVAQGLQMFLNYA